MATVRLQVRRGTADQWASVNPILAAGEMGLESDTNFIKFGNGTDHWADLGYANEPLANLENTLEDYVLVGDVGNAGGPAGPLTVGGKIPSSQLDITELSQDAVNSAIVAGTGLDKTYDDNANTITLDIDSTVATKTYADGAVSTHSGVTTSVHGISDTAELATKTFAATLLTGATKSNITISGDKNGLTISAENGVADSTTSDLTEGTNLYFTTERAQDAVGNVLSAENGATVHYDDAANTIKVGIDQTVIATHDYVGSEITSAIAPKADLASPTFTGVPHAPNPSSGSNGTQIATTSFVQAKIADIVDGAPTALNTLNEIALALQGDETTLGALITTVDGKQDKVANISSSEIATLDGVTGNIQDQIDDITTEVGTKLASATAASTYAPLASPTFTGTVILPTGTVTSEMILNNTITNADLATNADIAKTKIAGVAVTQADEGTVTSLMIVNGTILNADINSSAGIDPTKIAGTAVTQSDTGTVTSAMIATGTIVDSDINASASIAPTKINGTAITAADSGTVTETLLAASAVTEGKIADSAVTSGKIANGTIVNADISNTAAIGITKIDGLQTALDTKANLAGGATFTGTVVLPSTTSIGNVSNTEIGYLDGTTAKIQDQLDLKATLADPTFTGTVGLPSTTSIGDVSSTEISYVNGVTSAIQTQLDAKATSSNLSSHTSATTTVHGIADTANLVATTDTGTVTSAMIANGTIVDGDINASAAIAQSKISGLTSDLAAKSPLASPTFTGTVTLPANTITNTMMSDDSVDTAEIKNLAVTNSKLAGSIDWTKLSVSSTVSATELGYVDGVTSAIQTQLDAKLALSGGTMTGALTLSGAPTVDLHAATKAYVDNVVSGINFHQPVRVATTANITLSGTQTIDGVSLSVGDRVLVKDQTDQKQNGIYVVASSTWSRATDADNTPAGELAGGDFCLVLEGTAGSGYGYVCSNTSTITIGSTNITYAPFNAAKAITAGSGLTESTPGTLDIATGGVTSAMIADGTIVDGDINASAAIAQSKISGLTSALAAKAPLADPTFTGTVTVAAAGVAFTDKTQTKAGVPSRTPIATTISASTTLAGSLQDNMVPLAGAVAITIGDASNALYAVGESVDFYQASGTGASFAKTGSVNLLYTPGLALRTTYSSATVQKITSTDWLVYGDLKA